MMTSLEKLWDSGCIDNLCMDNAVDSRVMFHLVEWAQTTNDDLSPANCHAKFDELYEKFTHEDDEDDE